MECGEKVEDIGAEITKTRAFCIMEPAAGGRTLREAVPGKRNAAPGGTVTGLNAGAGCIERTRSGNESVQPRVLHRLLNGRLRGIDAGDLSRSGQCRVQTKRPCVSKAVQHPGTGAETRDGPPVFFLVKEKAGLLTVFHIDDIMNAVLRDPDLCVKRLSDKALAAGQPFLFADLRVAPLIDPADPDPVLRKEVRQRIQEQGL